MSNYGCRPHIESALTLDVRRLARMGILREGARGSLTCSRDGTTAAMHCIHCGPAVLPVVDGRSCGLGCPWCFVCKEGGSIPRPPATESA